LMLSACTDDGTLVDAINRAEVYRYYEKPWDGDALRLGLRDALRHYWRMHDPVLVPTGFAGETLKLVDLPA